MKTADILITVGIVICIIWALWPLWPRLFEIIIGKIGKDQYDDYKIEKEEKYNLSGAIISTYYRLFFRRKWYIFRWWKFGTSGRDMNKITEEWGAVIRDHVAKTQKIIIKKRDIIRVLPNPINETPDEEDEQ